MPVFLLCLGQKCKVYSNLKGEKIFGQVIARSFLWFVSLCAILIVGIIGCGGDDNGDDEDNEWVGTWVVETRDGENIQVQFEAIELLAEAFGEEVDIFYIDNWTFDDDGTWHREVTMKVETADDREMASFELMGTYSLSGSNYTITVNDVTVIAEGDVDFLEEADAETDFESGDIETGTWSRKGDTLTLTSDDGHVVGFKKT